MEGLRVAVQRGEELVLLVPFLREEERVLVLQVSSLEQALLASLERVQLVGELSLELEEAWVSRTSWPIPSSCLQATSVAPLRSPSHRRLLYRHQW